MNKEERVKLVFETISKIAGFEITPDKEFYVVANGEKDVYKIDENSNLYCKMPEGYFRPSGYSILPIFKGGYQLEEIKEPLLTEEGKDFLRQFKFESLEVRAYFSDIGTIVALLLISQGDLYCTIPIHMLNYEFKGLEANRKYTEKELGL